MYPIFALPHAGASTHAFRPLAAALVTTGSNTTELRPLEYPGTGRRIRERRPTDLTIIANEVADTLAEHARRGGFGVYGHSMGAHVAMVASRELRRRGERMPDFVVVSGSVPPHRRERDQAHELDDAGFIARLERYEGLPPEFLADEGLTQLFLPILRADFQAIEEYAFEEPPFDFPLAMLHGDKDRSVPLSMAQAWQDMTTAELDFHVFEGGHFFPFGEATQQVAGVLARYARLVRP